MDKRYSQRGQAEGLKRYCEVKDIQIGQVIFEDHPAKYFNRPAWQKLLLDIKRKREQLEFILFTK